MCYKNCQWPDSNPGPHGSEVTVLPLSHDQCSKIDIKMQRDQCYKPSSILNNDARVILIAFSTFNASLIIQSRKGIVAFKIYLLQSIILANFTGISIAILE